MISFKIEKDGDEFHAWCPELAGCHTHGKNYDEATENLKEAIGLYLEVLAEEQLSRQNLALTA